MRYRDYEYLLIELDGRTLIVTINRPEKLNAINAKLHTELSRVFAEISGDPGCDAVVITGAGKAFCAGGDTRWMQDMIDDEALWERTVVEAKRIVYGILDLEKPVVAKINGTAAGLGATIALFCDVIFASDKAQIGDPHVKVGFAAGDGGAAIWPQLIGYAKAKELLFTGDFLSAADAERIGLINHCVPHDELDARVAGFCRVLGSGAVQAIERTKQAINLPLRQLVAGSLDASLSLEGLSNRSREHAEAVRAFNERRRPDFASLRTRTTT